jgi:hypothetical protein
MQKYWWYKTEWHSKMDKSMQVGGMGERTREAYLRSMRQLVEHYDKSPDLIAGKEAVRPKSNIYLKINPIKTFLHEPKQ